MIIQKVVFAEANDNTDKLGDLGFIEHTDYGTREIDSDNLNRILKGYDEDEWDLTKSELLDLLGEALGTDVRDALINKEIDLVIVVY